MDVMLAAINPIAIELGPISIHWYGIIIGVALILGLYLAMSEGKRQKMDEDIFVDLVLWGLPIAIICARAYYVLFNLDYYKQNPGDIIRVWNGGIAIHGALIGAVVTTVVFCRIKKVSFWKVADIAAPSLLLGQMFGRWGNFINQEAFGTEVSKSFLESLHLPNFIINQMYVDGAYHHPTFLYESLWSLAGVILLLVLRRRNLLRGEIFLTYLTWYSIGRYFVEHFRTDSLMLTSHLRMAQVVSLVLILVSIGLVVYRRFFAKSTPRYEE